MATGTQEKDLKQHIEDYLCGYVYQGLAPQAYYGAPCPVPCLGPGLVPAGVPAFTGATQPRGYAGPQVLHGLKSGEQLLQRRARLVAESGGLGVDADAVPGGIGPFGRTRTNFVPVAGIASAWLNFDRLRTADCQPVEWQRKGPQYGKDGLVDCCELTSFLRESLGERFISPCHQRIPELAPEGFFPDEQ